MSGDRSLQPSVLVDENGNPIAVTSDGGDYKPEQIAKLRNGSGTLINPATEDSLATIDGVLDSIKDTDGIKKITDPLPAGTNNIGDVDVVSSALPSGAATEATLASVDGKVATETTIDAIRDNIGEAVASPASNTLLDRLKSILATLDSINLTDGIKKIVDALPVGDNWIGKVKVGDGTNNAAVVADNSINRLETRNTIVGQTAGAGSEKKVSVIDDVEDSSVKRLQTQALLAPGSTVNIGTSIPADPANLEIEFLTNGASHDMLVDGSTTPVNFTYAPGTGKTVSVESLLFVFAADDFEFDGASFGPLAAMTNGIDIKLDIGGVVTTIFTIQQNEDFLRVPGRVPVINNTGPKDLLSAAFSFGGLVKLVQADGDQIIATVNDDLTSTKLKYLTATLYGAEE